MVVHRISFKENQGESSLQTPIGFLSAEKVAHKELQEYFSKKRKEFTLHPECSGTPFQKAVWEEVKKIPYGETVTYQDIANRISKPKAVRAVANAVGANPVAILIPCHRVVRTDGSLGGYAYGAEKKRWLLDHEQSSEQLR